MTASTIFEASWHGGAGWRSATELMIALLHRSTSATFGLGWLGFGTCYGICSSMHWAAISLAMEVGSPPREEPVS